MSDAWVVNSSPIISLAKIGRLDLLEAACPGFEIPYEVAVEIVGGPPSDPARRILESGWGRVVESPPTPSVVLDWELGAGESAVLAHALIHQSTAVLDDGAARKCARSLGVSLTGTVGVILRTNRDSVAVARTLLSDLRATGFHLRESSIESIFKEIEERS